MMGWCCYGCTMLRGIYGKVALSQQIDRYLNSSLCIFPSATSGLVGD